MHVCFLRKKYNTHYKYTCTHFYEINVHRPPFVCMNLITFYVLLGKFFYSHTYIYIYQNMYTHECSNTCTKECMFTYMHTHIKIVIIIFCTGKTCVHTREWMCVLACIHACIQTYAHFTMLCVTVFCVYTFVHMRVWYMHTYTRNVTHTFFSNIRYIYAHTHTHILCIETYMHMCWRCFFNVQMLP